MKVRAASPADRVKEEVPEGARKPVLQELPEGIKIPTPYVTAYPPLLKSAAPWEPDSGASTPNSHAEGKDGALRGQGKKSR